MEHLQIYADLQLPEGARHSLIEGLRPHEIIFSARPAGSALVRAEPDDRFGAANVAFGQPDEEAVLSAERLKWIHLSSAGYTRYDTPGFREAAKARGLMVTTSSTVYANPCADHVLAFMLAQSRQLPAALEIRCTHQDPKWQGFRDTCVSLRGARVLIAGYGAIGRRLVELLRPYEMEIVAFRRRALSEEGVSIIAEQQLSVELGRADHVINVLPASAKTTGFFSEERFAAMAPGAIFYNIGRGDTVDQSALLAALQSGRLGAAWLDVTSPEPLPDDHPLWRESRCHITPHIAGGQADERDVLVRHFLANFQRFLEGKPLRDRVI
ncbi:N/A [soil metagenome]